MFSLVIERFQDIHSNACSIVMHSDIYTPQSRSYTHTLTLAHTHTHTHTHTQREREREDNMVVQRE